MYKVTSFKFKNENQITGIFGMNGWVVDGLGFHLIEYKEDIFENNEKNI